MRRCPTLFVLFIGLLLGGPLAMASAAKAEVLTLCLPSLPDRPNPALAPLQETSQEGPALLADALFDTLTRRKPGSAEIEPGLATQWSLSEDRLTWRFTLRSDVSFVETDRFTPTRPLQAEDVVFSLLRLIDAEHPYHRVSGGLYPAAEVLDLAARITAVEAVDPETLTITLATPDSGLPALLSRPFAVIHSLEYAEALRKAAAPERLDREPVGTGPYRWQGEEGDAENRVIRFQARDEDHWSGWTPIPAITLIEKPDPERRRGDLLSGDCHTSTGLGGPQAMTEAPALEGDPEITVETNAMADVTVLALNTARPPFDDPELRAALMAITTPEPLIDTLFGIDALAAQSPLPPVFGLTPGLSGLEEAEDDASPAVPPTPPETKPDPDAPSAASSETATAEPVEDAAAPPAAPNEPSADALMLQQQLDRPIRIWAPSGARPYNADPSGVARRLAAQWAEQGILSEVTVLDLGPFLARSRDVEAEESFDVLLWGWASTNPDPIAFLAPLVTCDQIGAGNRSHWCDPDVDSVFAAARKAETPEDRDALLTEALQAIATAKPIIPLMHQRGAQAYRVELSGGGIDPFGALPLRSFSVRE